MSDHDAASHPSVFGVFDLLLRRPAELFERAREEGVGPALRLLLGALVSCLVYGAAAGFFQGGAQIWVSSFKAPLIVLASLALCVPSFYVLSALAGVAASGRWLVTTLAGLAGILGLLLLALVPIVWLFSVSSVNLVSVVLIHVMIWTLALGFGYRFLAAASSGSRGPFGWWILLFALVSFQVASQMRPVLWRPDGMALFAPQRMFFIEHFFGETADVRVPVEPERPKKGK